MATTMHPHLYAAVNSDFYADKPLPVVQATIKNGLRHCNAADMLDFMSILKTFACGPFLTSINSFHPHPSQSSLNNAAVARLCKFFLVDSQCQVDSVKGLVHTAYTIIPTQQWESLMSPSLPTSLNPSALQTFQDLPSGYPFSHGHSKAALQAMLNQPETCDTMVEIYGEELMWPVYVMSEYLLEFISQKYWMAYIFYLNHVDPAQKSADSTELFATWLFHIDHLYNQLYCSVDNHCSVSTLADKKIINLYSQSKTNHLTLPKRLGEPSLNHPHVCSTMATALHISPACLNFHQAVFKVIKKCNYWPIVTFLELRAAQLQPYAGVPYQHWNNSVSNPFNASQASTAPKRPNNIFIFYGILEVDKVNQFLPTDQVWTPNPHAIISMAPVPVTTASNSTQLPFHQAASAAPATPPLSCVPSHSQSLPQPLPQQAAFSALLLIRGMDLELNIHLH
ncbi:hypothetical protein C8Q76DRAFT_784440 [Earliella scabrosa]|nr:hypothetical protein C8Q76DRAFT_784440 [Earliella scabrosa]